MGTKIGMEQRNLHWIVLGKQEDILQNLSFFFCFYLSFLHYFPKGNVVGALYAEACEWPHIEEKYFEKAAFTLGISDYRKLEINTSCKSE